MGKLLSWIVLGLFVVVVPFGSWYYLDQGLSYRKAALAELLVKDSVSNEIDTLGILQGKTSVLALNSSNEINRHLDQLNEQFKKTEGFQILSYDTSSAYIRLPQNYLDQIKMKYVGNDYVLIDTASHIRNAYKADMDGIKKLIEHLAIVIPRVKEVDIKLKQ
jgi:hypothetical protein